MYGDHSHDLNTTANSVPHGIPIEAQDLFHQASELSHHGKTEGALQYFKKAVEIAPDYTHALHEIGNCLSDLGRQEEASEYYNRALHEIGNRLYEIGRYEESVGRYWIAISRYEEAGKYYNWVLSPDLPPEGLRKKKNPPSK
jgi:tetratricopeptide (TPR) repeat protein